MTNADMELFDHVRAMGQAANRIRMSLAAVGQFQLVEDKVVASSDGYAYSFYHLLLSSSGNCIRRIECFVERCA